jgi:hypothetical protein
VLLIEVQQKVEGPLEMGQLHRPGCATGIERLAV